MAESCDACYAVKKLCEKQNQQHKHADSDQQFGQGKGSELVEIGQRLLVVACV